ncbi:MULTISPECIES: low temperature requirement protein A [Streptomycetaceae]|uniref:Integral membrane protein n=1 Tax=Streptantibioticus cattleyicolor (strain ATCC 35852 / DSM 46488 / JCM 4925 / NBRC 14057 / NRRL 8057) TaxID=1003195 RepID=F8JTB4_STREN|nr:MULTISPECIES: low temperature requirement protein A [Streptomycetaceae]AEW94263.1 integral membrane protein [Streptantibioticus cattleyicolor NRRL 8057 = DSM 46488]MYS58919.1 low temperature requirement protein A [Streptomyces sp. SID5468]CCB74618.1 Integral membrane protein [Streptantibioticus cattleyicolor NRRL 8057 = DSM 46488]
MATYRPYRRMAARGRGEGHRVATPLELFFDLCFVVAVAQAGARLAHALEAGHAAAGVSGYAAVFFAVWWAWMNFSWFASAYDNDDVAYRVATLVQIAGVLVLAAGVPRAFDRGEFGVTAIGYLVMRLALVGQWSRAAHGSRGRERVAAGRYAAGVAMCQVGWLVLLLPPGPVPWWAFVVMVAAELTVPVVAEAACPTAWHPHHIAERYGLFTIIVLGETISAATVAVQTALDRHGGLGELLPLAFGGLLIVFAAWWIYFAVPIHERLTSNRRAFAWGYGHYAVFASAAAIGAGMEVAVAEAVGTAHIGARAAGAAVTVPAAVYLFTVWLLHARTVKRGLAQQLTLPCAAVLVLCCTPAGRAAVPLAGGVSALTVVVGVALAARGGRTGARTAG